MGKPGARKNDQIVSVTPGDVHIIMIPSPGGPVPTPIPHPCASMINGGLAEKVKVMGQPGAVKGSTSKHTPPHIPMGPGPFQKPPANKGEIVTASSNVFYEGKEAAMLGDTAKMCSDPSDTPVGKVIGTAAMVLVGGGGAGSDEARAEAAAAAMKAATAECHRWINANMPPGPHREQAHRSVCAATGHPVDVATGKLFTRQVDVELPGRIPVEFVRNYSSARPEPGPFGFGWRHSFDFTLIVHEAFVAHRDANGRYVEFEPVAPGMSSRNALTRMTLSRTEDRYIVRHPNGREERFSKEGRSLASAKFLNLEEIKDRHGNRTTFLHSQGRLDQIVDSAGRAILLRYDSRGFVTELRLSCRGPSSSGEVVRRFAYSEAGDLIGVTDALGRTYEFEYRDHLLVRETDRNGFSFFFAHDPEGWCVETWGDGGLFYRRLDYDRKRGRTLETDSLGRRSVYRWDERGVVVELVDSAGHRWATEWDASLSPVRVEDPAGNAWTYAYDVDGRIVASENPEGASVALEWLPDGRPSAYTNQLGHTVTRTYDDAMREAREVDPILGTTTEILNERGDLVRVVHPDTTETAFDYDSSGNQVKRTTPDGLEVLSQYSEYGDLVGERDQYGQRLVAEYDVMRRVAHLWRRGHGSTRFAYDAEGNPVEVVRANGTICRYAYTQGDRIESVSKGGPARGTAGPRITTIRRFEYDTENRVRAVHYPGGNATRLSYEDRDRPMRIDWADGRTWRYERDGRGFVSEFHENGQRVFSQSSDSIGRVLRRTTGDGEVLEYEYDAAGKLIRASGSGEIASVEIERDPLGRRVRESGEIGAQAFAHATAARHLDYSWEADLAIACDRSVGPNGPRLSIGKQGGAAIQIEFDRADRMSRVSFPRGEVHEFSYGDSDLPAFRRFLAPDQSPSEELLAYDASGLLTSSTGSARLPRQYERDDQERLVGCTLGNIAPRRFDWAFDAAGDRVRSTSPDATGVHHQFGPGHRLLEFGSTRLAYDSRGRVESIVDGREAMRCHWNALGQLVEVKLPNGSTVRFRYDALGRRVEKSSNRGVTRFAWAGNQLIHERLPDGEERHYLYEEGTFRPLILFRRRPDDDWREHAIATDLIGSPWRVTAGDGRPLWQVESMPWGETLSGGSIEQGFQQGLTLPGQYRDEETSFHYNHARYYFPRAGVYLTPDPAGLDGGDDPYGYVADPICWSDPTGLSADDYKVKLALGVWGKNKPEFDAWAAGIGAQRYGALSEGVRGGFQAQIRAAMNNADEIHFNLKDYQGGQVRTNVKKEHNELNDFGEEPKNGYTNYELYQLKHGKDPDGKPYRDKVIWHDENGNQMPKGWMPAGW